MRPRVDTEDGGCYKIKMHSSYTYWAKPLESVL